MRVVLASVFCLTLLQLYSTEVTSPQHTGSNIIITDDNWEQMLKGEWMLKFYAPWCPACRAMEETWLKLATWVANDDNGRESVRGVGSVDVTTQVALNGRFMITKLPTIYHVKDGEFRQYTGKRELQDFIEFIGNEEWKDVSAVSTWTSPTSFIMSSMSKLFTFSMQLKSYHSYLSSEHGFPQWLSMLLFGTLIILVGLLLGIVFVLASDYFWGPPDYYDEGVVQHKKDDDAGVGGDADADADASHKLEKEEEGEKEGDEETTSDSESNLRQRKKTE